MNKALPCATLLLCASYAFVGMHQRMYKMFNEVMKWLLTELQLHVWSMNCLRN